MPALKLDVTIEQGATFQREFTVTNPADSSPFNFAGFIFRGKLRDNKGNELTTFDVSANTNKILAELSATKTAALKAGITYNCKYDIEAESNDGIVYRIAYGRGLVSEEQTH